MIVFTTNGVVFIESYRDFIYDAIYDFGEVDQNIQVIYNNNSFSKATTDLTSGELFDRLLSYGNDFTSKPIPKSKTSEGVSAVVDAIIASEQAGEGKYLDPSENTTESYDSYCKMYITEVYNYAERMLQYALNYYNSVTPYK